MNERIRKILEDDSIKNGYTKLDNDFLLLEALREGNEVYKELVEEYRWWNEYRIVIKVGDTYIGYFDADTTGDMSATEAGYEIDLDAVCEMEQVQKTITSYVVKKKEKNK